MIQFFKHNDKVYFAAQDMKFSTSEIVDNGKTLKRVSGLAIVYNTLSDDRGGYFVRIKPNSARFTTPVLALYNHEYQNLIGNTENGTLRLTDSPEGIKVEIDLPDTQLGNDIYTLLKDGYMKGASFGAVPLKTSTSKENGVLVEDYLEMLVDEISLTPVPAFTKTKIVADDKKEEPIVTEPVDEVVDNSVTEYQLKLKIIDLE